MFACYEKGSVRTLEIEHMPEVRTFKFLSRSISDYTMFGYHRDIMLVKGKPTMISPSSPLGMLLSWISFTATVSPVAQFKAPTYYSAQMITFHEVARRTINLPKRALSKRIAQLLLTRECHFRLVRCGIHWSDTNVIIE